MMHRYADDDMSMSFGKRRSWIWYVGLHRFLGWIDQKKVVAYEVTSRMSYENGFYMSNCGDSTGGIGMDA